MEFLEKDLEEIIFKSKREKIVNAGLRCLTDKGKMYRQLRIGNYGVADLVTVRRYCKDMLDPWEVPEYIDKLVITVYELKKDAISISAFLQAVRYAKGIKSYIKDFRHKDIDVCIEIVLVGRKSKTNGDVLYLNDVLGYKVRLYDYTYEVDGIKFRELNNYSLINEGF